MHITKVNCPSSKYPIKCPLVTNMEGITIHNTANDASAMAEVSYMLGNNQKVSYHVAVDDYRIVEALPFNRSCYASGDGKTGFGNAHTINIEICYSLSGGSRFDNAEELCAEYVAYLLKLYGWNIDRVGTHQMRSGKYCPHRTLDYGWNRFLQKIQKYLNPIPNIEEIIDLDLYSYIYEDLHVFGGNKDLLKKHLYEYGLKEGRTYSYVLEPLYYRDKYADVRQVIGNDLAMLSYQFVGYGINEGRQGSRVFDVSYYKKYAEKDIKIMNNKQATQHFLKYGINEWRQKTSAEFNVVAYRNRYKDLRDRLGNNCKAYYGHFIKYAIKDHRIGT